MRYLWLLAFTLVLSACGNDKPSEPETREGPAGGVPSTPEAALAWVKEAAGDETQLRARLEAWTGDAEGFAESEETRVVLTWQLRLALQDGDVETALRRQHMLLDRFGGEGISPEGRPLPADVIVGAIFDESLYQARVRIEGAKPDLAGSESALRVAQDTVAQGDEEAATRIKETATWVRLEQTRDLAAPLRFSPAVTSGPWVLVFADDFALGEGVFLSVLERWQRDGADAGLRVEVVPIRTGQVRVGIRRLPAESADEELASIAQRAKSAGLSLAPGKGVPAPRLTAIGLGPQETALLVVDAAGRIVGRLSGTNVDPRALDLVIERLISR